MIRRTNGPVRHSSQEPCARRFERRRNPVQLPRTPCPISPELATTTSGRIFCPLHVDRPAIPRESDSSVVMHNSLPEESVHPVSPEMTSRHWKPH